VLGEMNYMRYTKEDKELKLFDKDDYALMMKSLEVVEVDR
jgi:hypothetical protein